MIKEDTNKCIHIGKNTLGNDVVGRTERFNEHGDAFVQITEIKYFRSVSKNDFKTLTSIIYIWHPKFSG